VFFVALSISCDIELAKREIKKGTRQ